MSWKVNFIKHLDKIQHLFFWNFAKKLQRKENSQTHSMRPPSYWYQNQTKILKKKKEIISQNHWWPDGQYWSQIDYILCSQRWRSSKQSEKTRLGADCGSVHELLIAKFRLKLKKVEKATRPFRYDLNQIPNEYTVELTIRFKGLDLIECQKNYGQRFITLYKRQGSRPSPRKRNSKWQMVLWGGLTNSWEKKRS